MESSELTGSQQAMHALVNIHAAAYRAAGGAVEQLALLTINQLFRPRIDYHSFRDVGKGIADISVVDIGCTATRIAAHKVYRLVTGEQLYSNSLLMTRARRRKRQKIFRLKNHFRDDSIAPEFSIYSAQLVEKFLPKISSDQLPLLPPFAERHILYRGGLLVRYVNYKINQWTDYRNIFVHSSFRRCLEKYYFSAGTTLSDRVICPSTINFVTDIEYLVLKVIKKLQKNVAGNTLESSLGTVLFRTFARSIRLMEEADDYLSGRDYDSKEEAFIARLDWYKRRGALPKGAPDPHKERLTSRNLQEKLDEALYGYLDDIADIILEKVISKMIKSRLIYGAYQLEGKYALRTLISRLIGDHIVKQFSDPHRFVLSVLYAIGIETIDYDLEGFGRGNLDRIFQTAQTMIQAFREGPPLKAEVAKTYENSGLKKSPCSMEGIEQKLEAKNRLREIIDECIYQAIKGNDYYDAGLFKGVRETISDLPYVGVAMTSFHVLFNGLYYSLSYLGKKESDNGFFAHLLRSFSGRKLSCSVANQVIDLIYHPGWLLVILELIEAARDQAENRSAVVYDEEQSLEDKRSVVSFLFHYLGKDLREMSSFADTLYDFFPGENVIDQIAACIPSSERPWLESVLESSLPSIQESILYCRLVMVFRSHAVYFEGDDKFWEFFMREFLNRLVESKMRSAGESDPSFSIKARIRACFVEVMLTYNDEQLWQLLSKPPDIDAFPRSAISLATRPATCSRLIHRSRVRTISSGELAVDKSLASKIKWDYLE